ncbi:uncharacterized protein MONOS_15819 [Monocercomonoides exilis]|uniref:uncharacterized protein n=1 Tax=Monocercomonoides exilis TaxID=2049356 RepID=UPI00355A5F03|nr:hypothetical protein MONOS_15819 [Monocercomonoides exilis]|eukprot:MONOS_15819.1-p1 / transcript=MONOS_15819.1 / gene=MONOS_15819 / organism=Monocercomonoides_exilis_PA203 / gene_product=unspecified product / transcript_product=unspecified product / location=Mono_scaffold01364:4771-5710(+) / protein_length=283 / sequence_SO=supercontig / SO=protein_coding / is_pseudo=false
MKWKETKERGRKRRKRDKQAKESEMTERYESESEESFQPLPRSHGPNLLQWIQSPLNINRNEQPTEENDSLLCLSSVQASSDSCDENDDETAFPSIVSEDIPSFPSFVALLHDSSQPPQQFLFTSAELFSSVGSPHSSAESEGQTSQLLFEASEVGHLSEAENDRSSNCPKQIPSVRQQLSIHTIMPVDAFVTFLPTTPPPSFTLPSFEMLCVHSEKECQTQPAQPLLSSSSSLTFSSPHSSYCLFCFSGVTPSEPTSSLFRNTSFFKLANIQRGIPATHSS